MQNYSLDDSAEDPILSNGQQRESSFDRHDQTVFDLSMDYDDDDQVLLDWEQYAGMKRVRCCGLDCTGFVTRLPCARYLPPSWWYQLTRKQKRLFWWVSGSTLAALAIILIIVALPASSKAAAADSASDAAADASDVVSNTTNTAFLSQYSSCSWNEWRLPNDAIRPAAYNLSLDVQLDEPYIVTGTVQIQLDVMDDTPCVVLHTSRMNISAVSVLGLPGPGNLLQLSCLLQRGPLFTASSCSMLAKKLFLPIVMHRREDKQTISMYETSQQDIGCLLFCTTVMSHSATACFVHQHNEHHAADQATRCMHTFHLTVVEHLCNMLQTFYFLLQDKYTATTTPASRWS